MTFLRNLENIFTLMLMTPSCFCPKSGSLPPSSLTECLCDIKSWLSANFLELNNYIILFGYTHLLQLTILLFLYWIFCYSNSILSGVPQKLLHRLHLVQNETRIPPALPTTFPIKCTNDFEISFLLSSLSINLHLRISDLAHHHSFPNSEILLLYYSHCTTYSTVYYEL